MNCKCNFIFYKLKEYLKKKIKQYEREIFTLKKGYCKRQNELPILYK